MILADRRCRDATEETNARRKRFWREWGGITTDTSGPVNIGVPWPGGHTYHVVPAAADSAAAGQPSRSLSASLAALAQQG